ncbi:hypothetical protein BV25DRAFT_1838586 [Artomyces pyxidatus]|uniref:Uncharacterized protein n=1 Tax=Artomyces pyxidatus TaxID=48021 RepID=A0ACB8SZT3_9AGAM|nr:hypothetical protein BV25DRAFT_1838586 [Artomyces pyxidatus]
MSAQLRFAQESYTDWTPPELWIDIFEWATFVPGLNDVDLPNPFDHLTIFTPGDAEHTFRERDVKASVFTQKSIVLVCKDWLTIATPLLYRCLIVRNRMVAERLGFTLNASQLLAGQCGGASVGSHTRHLIIQSRERCDLSIIASSLPNLQILTCFDPTTPLVIPSEAIPSINDLTSRDTTPVDALSFLRALLGTCGSSLRRIGVKRLPYSIRRDVTTFTNMCMNMAPRLHTLDIPEVSLTRDLDLRPSAHPASTTDDIQNHEFLLPTWSSPDEILTIFQIMEIKKRLLDQWLPFFHIHGPFLTTVHLRFDSLHGFGSASRVASGKLSMVRTHCPNLRYLVLHFPSVPY